MYRHGQDEVTICHHCSAIATIQSRGTESSVTTIAFWERLSYPAFTTCEPDHWGGDSGFDYVKDSAALL